MEVCTLWMEIRSVHTFLCAGIFNKYACYVNVKKIAFKCEVKQNQIQKPVKFVTPFLRFIAFP